MIIVGGAYEFTCQAKASPEGVHELKSQNMWLE